MNKINRVALLGLQVIAATAGASPYAVPTQTEANPDRSVSHQLSLNLIEESWVKVPRICKSAAFHAQPTAQDNEPKNEAAQSLYATLRT